MDNLNITPAHIHMLILKARAVMVKEGEVTPDVGGNDVDDPRPDALQDVPGDLTREELVEELEGLNEDQLIELVALMWLGRGDSETEEWDELVQLAGDREETPTIDYLLGHPLVADYWAEGLDKLGYGSLLD
ncbi:DUF3775 domain-containing protein [Thalassovita mangrovi]|nr:DUF3775 domain-containing protein [Thalassovita mangrovi]